MSSRKKQGTRLQKKPYTKPEVKQVPLRPEEAVLGFCKTQATGGGPSSPTCNPGTCQARGS
jgi:hypothetical protein